MTTTARPPVDDDALDAAFGALANSTRRRILTRLAAGPASVNELAAPFDLTLPAISKHLKVLERAGLIVRGRRAQSRPCAIDPGPLDAVAEWTATQRTTWEQSFDRLDDYLVTLGIEAATAADRSEPDRSEPGQPHTDHPQHENPRNRRNPTDA